jgi:uncharacterized protein
LNAIACTNRASLVNVTLGRNELRADGISSCKIDIKSADGTRLPRLDVRLSDAHRASFQWVTPGASSSQAMGLIRAGVQPGALTVTVTGANIKPVQRTIELQPDFSDSYRDGTPDFLRLQSTADREAFRRWFTLLAEHEALSPVPAHEEINDCAALLRFSYREALKPHDDTWIATLQLHNVPAVDDVRKYGVPYTPLANKLFRVREGNFVAADINDGTFAEFADAKTLMHLNAHFISREVADARPGDILFYLQFGQHSPFHSMIFVGRSHYSSGNDWVVYHTGPNGKTPGVLKRVTLSSLLQHPDPRWRPVRGNSNFLGVYRWNILREAN